jgi:hypothetical protein
MVRRSQIRRRQLLLRRSRRLDGPRAPRLNRQICASDRAEHAKKNRRCPQCRQWTTATCSLPCIGALPYFPSCSRPVKSATVRGEANQDDYRRGFTLKCRASIFILLFYHVSALLLKAEQVGGGPITDLTFESFIQHPPSIQNAVWEEDVPRGVLDPAIPAMAGPGSHVMPAKAFVYRLVYDQQNYFLEHIADVNSRVALGGSGGQFGPILWGAQHGRTDTNCWITYFDTNTDPADYSPMQKPESKAPPYSMVNQELQARYDARRFLCLGMFEMVPGTAVWTNGGRQFTATYDEPSAFKTIVSSDSPSGSLRTNLVPLHGGMIVKLEYQNGVPVEALVALDCGVQYFVDYKYSRDFAAGRLPVEFSRYFDPSRGDDGKAYTIRVKDLKLASGPIPLTEFDFHEALHRKYVSVKMWKNGEAYRESPQGLMKALTAAEVAAGKGTRYGGKAKTIRSALFVFMILSVGMAVFFLYKARSSWLENQS